MVTFKYSFRKDVHWMLQTLKNASALESKGLAVFRPSLMHFLSLISRRNEPIEIKTRFPITCYWISSGTWGSYTPPDEIFICPWKKGGGRYTTAELKRVIAHEITHLYLSKETNAMSFDEREQIIRANTKAIYDECFLK